MANKQAQLCLKEPGSTKPEEILFSVVYPGNCLAVLGYSSANIPEVSKKNPDHSAAEGSYLTFDEHCHTQSCSHLSF